MSAFKAIAFDYDGTLFDTRSAIISCIERAFEKSGCPVPARKAIWRTVRIGLGLQATFLTLDPALRDDRAALQDRIDKYRTIYLDEGTSLLKPFAGTNEVLGQLHAEGTKCLIISNKGVAAIRRSLEETGLSPFIEMVLGDELGLPKKPDPAMMNNHILPRYTHLQREQILIVGDTEADILFAKRSGVPCCWASYGYGEMVRCRALEPEHEISSITELPPLMRRT